NGRLLFVNEKDNLLIRYSKEIPRVFYGPEKNNLHLISGSPFIKFQWNDNEIQTQMTGIYNFQNITAAVVIGQYFRIAENDIINSIEQYSPDNSRSQLIKSGNNTIILDSYNANPTSVIAALENLHAFQSDHDAKVVALGDMLELGKQSEIYHKEILETIDKFSFDQVILVGTEFNKVAKNNSYLLFDNSEQAAEYLKTNPLSDTVILIKGSRGIKMEKLLKSLD
ncbi:MAG: UDP-N-acetylmuramoyl-tripeptide--D-alanyl-D-alanine ligase, partial [Bacteroidales bacterium]|nr:UDP-N-acetylmuramoyl-tripeptide--D-alanyl-D-alanine ligase [Bacteroidales bacterium]